MNAIRVVRAHIVAVIAVADLEGGRSGVGLVFQVDEEQWDGPQLRWEGELSDPGYRRLLEVTGCSSATDFLLTGFPVDLELVTTPGTSFRHVVGVVPAPARRTGRARKWVRVVSEDAKEALHG